MPASPTTQQMGEKHEVFLAEVNGGTKSRSSGSQWADPADGRNGSSTPLPFAWDGKSTRGKGITITLDMIAKIREQAMSERPQIGLRWYGNDNLDLVTEDWIAVTARDWREVLELARRLVGLEAEHGDLAEAISGLSRQVAGLTEGGRLVAEALTQEKKITERLAGELREERTRAEAAQGSYEELARAIGQGRVIPPAIPALPWTVVYKVRLEGRVVISGMHYEADGKMVPFPVESVRVERTTANLPRLIVNDFIVREGDLYSDGKLSVRASQSNPAASVG